MRRTDAAELHARVRHIIAPLGESDAHLQQVRDELSEALQGAFGVARVSLWCLEGRSRPMVLNCVSLHTPQGQQPPGEPLSETEYGEYLRCVMREGVYASRDVFADANLTGLHAYFQRHAVRALLDAAFQINGQPRGVVCLEHVGEPRDWSATEKAALRRVASDASLAIARMEGIPRLTGGRG
jgi:GAF domain-containing protein